MDEREVIEFTEMVSKLPKNQYFTTGAVRSPEVAGQQKFPARYDLITPVGLRRLAETYGEGSLKYGDRNWEKGIPVSNLLNHALAHIVQYLAGDTTEDHMAHAAWNLFAVMHSEEMLPAMQDLPTRLR
jgi:hypothetical protein